MHRMSRRRQLPKRCKTAEEKTGGSGDREENPVHRRHALRPLRRERVTKMLNQIDGVSARVDLSKNQAVVSCDRIVSDEVLKEAVEKIGYHVTGIS